MTMMITMTRRKRKGVEWWAERVVPLGDKWMLWGGGAHLQEVVQACHLLKHKFSEQEVIPDFPLKAYGHLCFI